jgi:hypothetical protein
LDDNRESDWPDAESNCGEAESPSENLSPSDSEDLDFPTDDRNFLGVAGDVAMHIN